MTEDYSLEVVLPMGATDIQVHLPFDAELTTQGVQYSTLDLFGAPVVTVKNQNAFGMFDKDAELTITYKYSLTTMLIKPLYLS